MAICLTLLIGLGAALRLYRLDRWSDWLEGIETARRVLLDPTPTGIAHLKAAFRRWSNSFRPFPRAVYNDRPVRAAFIELLYELFGLHFVAFAKARRLIAFAIAGFLLMMGPTLALRSCMVINR